MTRFLLEAPRGWRLQERRGHTVQKMATDLAAFSEEILEGVLRAHLGALRSLLADKRDDSECAENSQALQARKHRRLT